MQKQNDLDHMEDRQDEGMMSIEEEDQRVMEGV